MHSIQDENYTKYVANDFKNGIHQNVIKVTGYRLCSLQYLSVYYIEKLKRSLRTAQDYIITNVNEQVLSILLVRQDFAVKDRMATFVVAWHTICMFSCITVQKPTKNCAC